MNHIKKIAAQLLEHDLDAMLITSKSGERYALGFHGEGLLLVTRDGAQYSTNGRYIEAERNQLPGLEICLTTTKQSHMAFAKEYITAKGLTHVTFASGTMTLEAHVR